MPGCCGPWSVSEFGDVFQLQDPPGFAWNELVLELTGLSRRTGIRVTFLVDREAPSEDVFEHRELVVRHGSRGGWGGDRCEASPYNFRADL